MVAPIDYGVQIADPTQAFLGAFKAGADIQEIGLKQEQQRQLVANQKLIQEGFVKLRSPNATAADYANLSMLLPETQAKAVRESFAMRSVEQQQIALQESGQIFSAFQSGRPEIAIDLIQKKVDSLRNAGNEAGAKFAETWLNVAKENPKNAEDYFGFTISQMPGGDKVITSAIALGGEKRAAAKAPSELTTAIANADKALAEAKTAQATATSAPEKAAADAALAKANAEKGKIQAKFEERAQLATLEEKGWNVRNLQSQISNRAAQLGLETRRTNAEVAHKLAQIAKDKTYIPADTRKLINESAVIASTSKQAANQTMDLSKRIEAAEGGKGALTKASEWMATTTGRQDEWTQMRNEYTRMRNTAAIKALPPGPATDKDIMLALKGFPDEAANAKTLASFLRGLAKMQDIEASISNSKTDWLAQNNGALTRATSTFIAGDYSSNPGETFTELTERIAVDMNKRYASIGGFSSLVEQVPTTQDLPGAPARPAAAPAQRNIRGEADAILGQGR